MDNASNLWADHVCRNQGFLTLGILLEFSQMQVIGLREGGSFCLCPEAQTQNQLDYDIVCDLHFNYFELIQG